MADIELGNLVWKITGDPTNLNKGIDSSKKKVGGLGGSIKKFALVAGAAFASIGVAKLGKSLIQAASDAEETKNKFKVVFQDVAKSADGAFKDLASGYGLARDESQKLLANTGDMLSGFGATGREALDTSVTINKLAVDLASFTNAQGGAAAVSEALTKGFLGERESLKTYGIAIGEIDLKKFAEDQGLVYNELTRMEKGNLTLQLALKQSKNAIGDFERSQASFANQSRIAQAGLRDMSVTMGETLLPFANLVVTAFNKMVPALTGAADKVKAWVTSASGAGKIAEGLGTAAGIMGAAFEIVKTNFGAVVDVFKDVGSQFKDVGGDIGGITGAFQILAPIVTANILVFRIIGAAISGLINNIKNLVKLVISAGDVLGTFAKAMTGDIGALKDLGGQIKNIKDGFTNLADGAVDGFKKLATTAVDGVKNFSDNSTKLADGMAGSFEKMSKRVANSTRTALMAAGGSQEELTDKAAEESGKREKRTKEEADKLRNNFTGAIQGITDTMSMVGDALTSTFQAFSNRRVEQIDAVLQADLEAVDQRLEKYLEAEGIQEESEIEKLERKKVGLLEIGETEEAAAVNVELTRMKAIERAEKEKAKLEKKAAKEKAELEYKVGMVGWATNLSMAVATAPLTVLNAYTSAVATPVVGMVLGPIAAALAGVAAAAQIAGVVAAKPQKPSFAVGTMNVPSDMTANIHKGEIIVPQNMSDSIRSGDAALVGEGGGVGSTIVQIVADTGEKLKEWIFDGTKNGEVKIADSGIVVV